MRRLLLFGVLAVARVAFAANPFEAEADRIAGQLSRRAGQPGAVADLAALVRLDGRVAPGRLVPPLRATAEGAGVDPLVAAHAAYHLALEEERRGEDAAAEGRWRRLGLIGDFWVAGPFDAQGRSGLDRPYPPEEEPFDPRARFAGKEREVGWRRAPPEAFRQGALLLDALLRPDSDAVAYLATSVILDRERTVALRLGTPGSVKVWVNGRLTFTRDVVRPAALDQEAIGVRLRKGANWVVVKTLVGQAAWRVFLRVTEPSGRPLSSLRATLDGVPSRVTKELAAPVVAVRHLAGLLQGIDRARYLALVQSEDVEAETIETALQDPGVEAALLLGELARKEDDRRLALERAESGAKRPLDRALAISGLAEMARARHRDAAAQMGFRRALEADPGFWPAALALAFEEQGAGLANAALARIEALGGDVLGTPRVARARARLLDGLGRRQEAEAALGKLYASRRSDVDLVQDLANAARRRGDLDEASRLLLEAARRRPELPTLVMEAARVLEGRGHAPQARAALERVAAQLPDDARLPEELGRLLARGGLTAEARTAFERALTLRPQNPALRTYAERLAAEAAGAENRADDLAARFAEPGETIAAEALAGAASTDSAIVLLDRQVVRVHPNGLSERFVQRLVHLRTDRAARDNQSAYVRYTPGAQEVEIRRARVFRRGTGREIEVSEATGRDDRDLSEPWYGLYYDLRAEVVSYEDLRAGDVVELQYTVADVGLRNEMADYFGDFELVGETMPKRRWDYTLIGPQGRTFFFNQKAAVEQHGAEVVYRFAAKDVPSVQPEPSMPGFAEVAPYLHVSTYRSWQDVARWWWHLAQDQLTPDETMRRAAAQALVGLDTDEQKVRALHRLVVEGTRYVALEFGIHGFKPYKVTQVFNRRFGDCKDKASLLYAFLREAGIDAELVLLRTRRNGRIATEPASLAVFDHAIVHVPRLGLYLDGTAEFSGVSELPAQDQGVMVLRIGPTGATLTETPVFPSAANRAARRWEAKLAPDGSAEVDERLVITGQAAPEWRAHYQTVGERNERYGKVWSGRAPGARLESLSFEGIEDRDRPLSLHARVKVPRLGEARGQSHLVLPVSSRDPDFVRSYARLSARRWDLVLGYPWQHEDELVYQLPDGWRVSRVPAKRSEQGVFGRFALDVAVESGGRAVRIRTVVDVDRARVSPSEYGAFRRFLGSVDAALGERLVIEKEDP